MFLEKEKLESFERVTIRRMGMCGIDDIEAVCNGSEVEITYYNVFYKDDEVRKPIERTTCDTENFLKILNDCNLLKWNGFHGERPRGLLDGTTFKMEAVVDGGRTIYADGSENFPAGYRELMSEMHRLLREGQGSA